MNSRARRSRTGTRAAANGSKIVSRKTTSSRRAAVLGRAVLRAASILGIGPRRLAQVIGVSASSISRLSRGTYSSKRTSKSWELAALVVRLYKGLDTIMAGDKISMRFWMWSPNIDLRATPAEHIVTVQGLVSVVGYVESFRARV